jgi:hypothetical protein
MSFQRQCIYGLGTEQMMRSLLAAVVAAVTVVCLTGCASSISKPTIVQALPKNPAQKLAIADVRCEAAPNVEISDYALTRMTRAIKDDLANAKPASLMAADNAASKPVSLKIIFTAYDSGNAALRAFMAGLGQVHIDADVLFLDDKGATIGKYKVSKQFALGGAVGGTNSIADVEVGFELSVVDLVGKNSG